MTDPLALSNMQDVTPRIAEKAACEALKPTERDFKNVQRTYREDGSYTWTADLPTKEAVEAMTPFRIADTRRYLNMAANAPKERLRSQDGSIQFADPGLAAETARRNGWRHVWRVGGATVELGTDGRMLWRFIAGDWEPTGRRCLGTPLSGKAEVVKHGVCYYDPAGRPWRFKRGEWRRTGGQAFVRPAQEASEV